MPSTQAAFSTTSISSSTSPMSLITVECMQPGQKPETLSSWMVLVLE